MTQRSATASTRHERGSTAGSPPFCGWRARPRPGPRHTIETTTPTGHTYISVAPRLSPEIELSPRERMVADVYWAA